MNIDLRSPIDSVIKIEAQIDGSKIQAAGGIYYPRLIVPLHVIIKGIELKHQNEVYSAQLGAIQGELAFNGQKISDSLQCHLNRLVYEFENDENVNLEFPLDVRRIEWIEQQRQGSFQGSVHISMSSLVLGQARGKQDQQKPPVAFRDAVAIQGDIPFTVPDTQWRESILPGLGYGKVIAIELPAIPIESFQRLDHSFKAMSQAQKLFQIGHYDDAVAKCRTALEQFFENVDADKGDGTTKKIPILKKSWEAKLGLATYNWLNESLGVIKAVSNQTHHTPNNHFDRLGAQMLIQITAALISYAANSVDGSS
jgi:hypothetical protein